MLLLSELSLLFDPASLLLWALSTERSVRCQQWFLKINPNGRIPALGQSPAAAALTGSVPDQLRTILVVSSS